jgi:hypothetical protein
MLPGRLILPQRDLQFVRNLLVVGQPIRLLSLPELPGSLDEFHPGRDHLHGVDHCLDAFLVLLRLLTVVGCRGRMVGCFHH